VHTIRPQCLPYGNNQLDYSSFSALIRDICMVCV
jgi:hypothetical protein